MAKVIVGNATAITVPRQERDRIRRDGPDVENEKAAEALKEKAMSELASEYHQTKAAKP
jgi:hypothetical protein